ncbi:hypothetical protein COHA_008888 [Chlorella ohadii]|uniref:RAP domain-containing protein n=1 Tax=Chlorella ohadii TaxID=2649997 RepID=A0AAD5GYL3_9CHLO|nr:hypothetical protein COHA_008888 [Chlorella ohadii]
MLEPGYFLRILQDLGAVDDMAQPTEQGLQHCVGQSTFMNVCINKLLAHCTDLGTIFSIVRDAGHLMDSINTSTAVHRLGKVVRRLRDKDAGLPKRVVQDEQYRRLVARVQKLAEGQGEGGTARYRPRGLANTLWGLAALGDVGSSDLALTLALRVCDFYHTEYRPQELSNVVWALGTLGVLCAPTLDTVLAGVVSQLKERGMGSDGFIPQALSNMVWACAHLRNGTRGCSGPTSGGGPPTTVAKDSRPDWTPSPQFLKAVASAATTCMPDFQSQSLANLLWGYCKLDVYPEELFKAAAAELVERFRTPDLARQFRAQELSNSLYAFAQGNIIHEDLLNAFERELSASWVELDSAGRETRRNRLDDFTSQALANSLWSFANLRWYPVRLLEVITRAVGRKLHSMSPQEISNSIWAYAKFAYHPGPVMVQYQAEIGKRVDKFDGQSLTTTLWALAALSSTHCDAFKQLVERFVELEPDGNFQDVQYNQVLQAVLLAQFEMQRRPGEFREEINLPDRIVDRALAAWRQQQQAVKLSAFHLEVSAALAQLGVPFEVEYKTEHSLLSVDIAIIDGDRKIAIEVDGPFHFAVNTNSPLGQTMIRRRLLRACGWIVISVPCHTWYRLPIERRPEYVSRLLMRADSSFHSLLMRVPEDLLSTEFKKGLGQPADGDAFDAAVEEQGNEARPGEGSAAAAGPWSSGRVGFTPEHLKELLKRRDITFTKSAFDKLVDQGWVKPGGESQFRVDEVDSENPLRPRYTDYAGNVLMETNEPFNVSLQPAVQLAGRVQQLAAQLSLKQLQNLCAKKGLSTSGTKAQLAERLLRHSANE